MEDVLEFAKYHGLGNDFVLVDNRKGHYDYVLGSADMRRALCNRRTGIGADGILEMKASVSAGCSVKMVYYNADGGGGSFCGNGARCFADFAFRKVLPLMKECLVFEFGDDIHKAYRSNENRNSICVEMKDVTSIKKYENGDYFLDTGSPHHVCFVREVNRCDVRHLGREIAWGDLYAANGCNVNFVQETDTGPFVRTYERGVEGETLACGTGLTAVAIARHMRKFGTIGGARFRDVISCNGGTAEIAFTRSADNVFSDITLTGPVCHLFDGTLFVGALNSTKD